ncbi:TetR/AcrR family transcriptional regulator [Streptomyces sp. NPDC046805]|uniref:TetR/AcrR family transcriptional regulator n=1 Tax=Streptomyces sp. NPDC046805 TaxID=3155134 RepID=UPI0033FAEC53
MAKAEVTAAGSPRQRSRKAVAGSREVSRKPSDERWKEILEVSTRMFADKGYAATSLQQIADDLGLLKGSLYYYITSKDDLLYEVIREVYVRGVENFRALAGRGGDAVERLRRAVEGHVVYLIEHLAATTVYLHEYERLSEEAKAKLAEFDYVKEVRDLIVIGQDQGGFRRDLDPALAALSVLGSTNWIYRWYHAGARAPEEIGREFADIAVRGLVADEYQVGGNP